MNNEHIDGTEHLTTVRVPRTLNPKIIMEIVYWLQDNAYQKYCLPVNGEVVFFHNTEDAVAFKLKFGL